MSVVESRGGIPTVFRAAIDTTGREYSFQRGYAFRQMLKYLQVRASTNPAKLYFRKVDFENDQNYVDIPVAAAATPWGYEGPAEVNQIWIKGNGGTADIEVIGYFRRG